jgi:hypothetical protein
MRATRIMAVLAHPDDESVQSQDMVYEVSLNILYGWGVGNPMLDDRRALD